MSEMSREIFDQQEHEIENTFEIQVMKENTLPTMKKYLDFITESVVNGQSDPLEMFAVVKKIEKMFSDAKSKIDEYALSEAEKQSAKSFTKSGINFELRNGGQRFDFKHIKEWVDKYKELKNIEERYKLALKNSVLNVMSVSEDGEVIELPRVTYSKNSLIVKQ